MVDIQRSSFHGNEAASGGALYLEAYSQVSLVSNTFVNNYAIDGGAIYTNAVTSVVESVFQDNYAENGVSRAVFNCAPDEAVLAREHM